MCDTNEHMLIGDQAAAWIPQMLKMIFDRYGGGDGASLNDYKPTADWSPKIKDANNLFGVAGDGVNGPGWFTNFTTGQFRLTFGADGSTGDWASYGDILALSGDYYDSEADMDTDADNTEKLINAWRASMTAGLNKDTDPQFGKMVTRAMSNWPHFGHDAIDMWLGAHRQAIDLAIRGRKGTLYTDTADDKTKYAEDPAVKDMGFSQTVAGLVLALRHNAFADHFLSDFFSAGHLRVQRKEFFTYLGPKDGSPGAPGTGQGQLIGVTEKLLKHYGGTRPTDIASTISGIAHDEDGLWGLWCKPHFVALPCTMNGIDGLTPTPGGSRKGSSLTWPAPYNAILAGDFYVRGDDGLLAPNNVLTSSLCYYTIALSIRDILYASVTGCDPQSSGSGYYGHAVKQPSGWFDCVGGQAANVPLYVALSLLPRPNDPSTSWKKTADNYNGGTPGPNHFPLMNPNIGFAAYYDSLRDHMCGKTGYATVASCTIRSYQRPLTADAAMLPQFAFLPTVIVTGGYYTPMVVTDPGSQYFDFLDSYLHGQKSSGLPVPATIWKDSELAAMLGRYLLVHNLAPGEKYDS